MCDSDSNSDNHPGCAEEKTLFFKHQSQIRENASTKRKLPVSIPTLSIPDDTCRVHDFPLKSPKIVSPGNSRVWSSPTCTICMEDLFSFVNPERNPNFCNSSNLTIEKNIRPILSTRCGHLFHTECINKWFQENKEKEEKECPFCKREMMANDTTRIFPIFEID